MKKLQQIALHANVDLEFVREGANHEIWAIAGERIVIPRHRDINEHTAHGIIQKAAEVSIDGKFHEA